ncbi:MAG: hypothetical protein QHH43_02775 [Candidatus Saccharicenans sp.]|nr:hypothetical protein [Candidatus Saccharicenans sp.]MDH7574668.1 hypothetical protein [Candidatus Saccharicenans sp.]
MNGFNTNLTGCVSGDFYLRLVSGKSRLDLITSSFSTEFLVDDGKAFRVFNLAQWSHHPGLDVEGQAGRAAVLAAYGQGQLKQPVQALVAEKFIQVQGQVCLLFELPLIPGDYSLVIFYKKFTGF